MSNPKPVGRKRNPESAAGIMRDVLLKMEVGEESTYSYGTRDLTSIYPQYFQAKKIILESHPDRDYTTRKSDELLIIKRTK
jgi:hypothetical protein